MSVLLNIPTASDALNSDIRAAIQSELVDIAVVAANLQLDEITTRLANALHEAGAHCADAAQKERCTNAASLLKKNRYPFSFIASKYVRAGLQRALECAAEGDSGAEEATAGSLAHDVEIDKNLCLRRLAPKIDAAHAERLAGLGIRLAYLFGREDLAPARHPFGAHTFLHAMHAAWCEFHPDSAAHPLVFPLLCEDLCPDLAPILHAVNLALAKRGILPHLAAEASDSVSKESQTLTQRLHVFLGQQARPTTDQAMEGDFPVLLEESVLRPLGQGLLLDYLDTLQKNLFDQHLASCAAEGPQSATVLTHIRQHAPKGSITSRDEKVIALLSAIFDAALREPGIPPEMRAMVASLQLPILKAVLNQPEFFFQTDQPALRAIELLVELAVGWDPEKGQGEPRYQVFKRNVERIQRSGGERPEAFADAVWDLESFMRREQTAIDHMLASPVARALHSEKKRLAEKTARHEVALRIGTGEVVAFVETFLEDKWVAVLTLAYSVKDKKPRAVRSALRTMDDLVWSAKPKITAAERTELLERLPALVASLNKWLDLVKWNEPERLCFFADLAKCHASLIRSPLDISPQAQAGLALEAARRAAERRRQVQAHTIRPVEPDEFDQRVRTLECGVWLEFAVPNGRRRLRLSWISPMQTFYLFTTRDRQQALSLSDEGLAAALRDQRAGILAPGGLVHRALCQSLGVEAAQAVQPSA
jgi:hypothetical protein